MGSTLVPLPEITCLIEDETEQSLTAHEVAGSDRDEVMVLYKRLHLSRKTGRERLLARIVRRAWSTFSSAPDRQHF